MDAVYDAGLKPIGWSCWYSRPSISTSVSSLPLKESYSEVICFVNISKLYFTHETFHGRHFITVSEIIIIIIIIIIN